MGWEQGPDGKQILFPTSMHGGQAYAADSVQYLRENYATLAGTDCPINADKSVIDRQGSTQLTAMESDEGGGGSGLPSATEKITKSDGPAMSVADGAAV